MWTMDESGRGLGRGQKRDFVDRGGGQKRDLFVDVIDGWPLIYRDTKYSISYLTYMHIKDHYHHHHHCLRVENW